MKNNILKAFLAKYQVFSLADLNNYILSQNNNQLNINTRNNLIAYHLKQNHIKRIRKELYQVIPAGHDPKNYAVDPYLLSSKLSNDAIISHHTALELLGHAYSVFSIFYYWTQAEIRHSFEYQDLIFKAILQPKILITKNQQNFGVKTIYKQEQSVRVTTLERTLVDVLERPKLAGEWEEIWRSLDSVAYLDIDEIYQYCALLENATTFAKVGFYLEQNQQRLAITDQELNKFTKHIPKNPCYLLRRDLAQPSKLVPRWNLIIPNKIISREWQEDDN